MTVVQANVEKAPGGTFERIAVVRAVPGRKLPLAIVHAFSTTGVELAVQERYEPSFAAEGGLDAAAIEILEQDARKAITLRHPNVASVREVVREGDTFSVVSEFVEGEVLEELRRLGASSTSFNLEVSVRIIVDVLSALSALHTMADGGLSHGEVTTHNIIVGYDGATRLIRPYRGRVAGRVAEPDWFAYAAPEVLKGGASTPRADLFSVGVLLWEALTKRQLFPKATREGRTSRNAPIAKATPPEDASWAAPLVAVAERALSIDPQGRYASAAEMAAAVRLAVRSKLAMPPRVAAVVDKLAGERILQRRTTLALPETSGRPSTNPSRPSLPNDAVRALEGMRPSSRPPTPKPGPVVTPAVPKAAPVPRIEPAPRAMSPRPAAPALKLSEPKPPLPRVAPPAKPAVPVSVLRGAEPGVEFGPEPPTIPRKKPEAPAAAAVEIAAPPLDILDVAKAVEQKLDAKIPESPPPKKSAEPAVAAAAVVATSQDTSVITAPAPEEQAREIEAPNAASIRPAGAGMGAQRGRRILIGVGALCALLLLGAGVRLLVVGGHETTPAPSATQPPTTKTTTTVAAATTTPPSANVPPPPSAGASATEAPEPSTSTTNTTGPVPVPDGSHRHHPRPRPTYDPMGI